MLDVAMRAGVSLKSVSRVINREPHVSDTLRAKVERAIAELDYVPDTAARSLAGARSFIISVLFDNPSPNYTVKLQAGVYRACMENQYHLRIDRIDTSRPDTEIEAQLASLLPVDWDIVHSNDWQTGLIPVYLREMYRHRPGLTQARSVFTIHNVGYQGIFWHWDMELTGLDWRLFNWRQLEFFGKLNLLKGAIVFADAITTVSPRYAEEIQGPEQGKGLEAVIRWHSPRLRGILNGVDYRVWDPATDTLIARQYELRTVREGKRVCKSELQRSAGLPVRADVPLLSMITRLDAQKGIELLHAAADQLLARDVQLIVLGTGEESYKRMLAELQDRYPDKVAISVGFDEVLAHRIQAGADMILIPSRYEPCGLTQLIALRYGTVPVVRATGGLADTIEDCTDSSLASGTANGFTFQEYTPEAFLRCVDRALNLWSQRELWAKLVRTGMSQDWSWSRSARQYAELYEEVRSEQWPRPEEFMR